MSEKVEVERIPIDRVQPHPDNARVGDVDAIALSLEKFGQIPGSVRVQRSTGNIVTGNHTWKAAKKLGWDYIDVVFVDLDDVKARAYMLADNSTADRATYDKRALIGILGKTLTALEGTGFSEDDFEALSEEMYGRREEKQKVEREEFETRDVKSAPEPTREIPLHIRTSEIETFAQKIDDLQEFWEVKTFPEVILRAVSEAHSRWQAGVGRVGRVGSADSLPKELKASEEF